MEKMYSFLSKAGKSRKLLFIVLGLSVVIGLFWATYYGGLSTGKLDRSSDIRLPGESMFVNKLIDSEPAIHARGLEDIKREVEKIIEEYEKLDEVEEASFYIRDLVSGEWTGVKEEEEYAPASMFKPFTAMVAYKLYEDSEEELYKKKYLYEGQRGDEDNLLKDEPRLVRGNLYSLDDLIRRSMVYSDNVSTNWMKDILDEEFGEERIFEVTDEIDIISPHNFDLYARAVSVSPKDYMRLFRVLYNSSYLDEEASSKILEYLSQATYRYGLVQGTSASVPIAHKFGYKSIESEDGEVIEEYIHDCGIVYVPRAPYSICIMTKGTSGPIQEDIIRDIAEISYTKMTEQ